MRTALNVLALGMIFVACHSKPRKNDKSTVSIELKELTQGLALASGAAAVVTEADLICGEQSYPLAFNGTHSVEVYRDITDCSVLLKTFKIGETVYDWSRNYTQDIGVFDGAENGSMVDRKLARQIKRVSESTCQEAVDGCDFRNVTLVYHYSELKAFEVELKNNLKISKLSVNAELEQAPSCDVSAQFVSSADPLSPPSLHILLANCVNTYQAGHDLEYGLAMFSTGHDYLIDELHDVITAQGSRSFDLPGREIILSLDDIKALTGETDTFEALKKDFILPLRNQHGISMAYYVIDNTCGDLPPPPPPTPAQGFKTYTQGGWGTSCKGHNPGCTRDQYFATIFPSGLLAGDGDFQSSGDTSFGIRLSSSADAKPYLGDGGTPGFLGQNYLNPVGTHEEGVLGTQLVALILNVEFDRTVFSIGRPGGQLLENLVYRKSSSALNGMTVKQIRSQAESALAGLGNPSAFVAAAFSEALSDINENFDNGTANKGLLFLP